MKLYDEWTKGLNGNQQKLIVNYFISGCRHKNGKYSCSMEVANQSGYKSTAAPSRFLNSNLGRTALRLYAEYVIDVNFDMLKADVIKAYTILAFYNPDDIIDADGFLKVNDLGELGELAICIKGIKTKYNRNGDEMKEIELYDRTKALDKLAQYVELFVVTPLVQQNFFQMSREEREKRIKELLSMQNERKLIE